LQTVLPEFLVGSINDLLLAVLVVVTLLYTLLVGEFVYSERQPSDPLATIVCEFFAGTCYATICARFFSVAAGFTASSRGARTISMLLFFTYSTTATFVATLRGEQQGGSSDIKFLPLWLVSERILKGMLGMFTAVFGNFESFSPEPSLAPSPPLPPLQPDGFSPVPLRQLHGPIALILLAMVITSVHLVLLQRWRTCSVTFVTRARVGLLCVALWGQLVTLLMLLIPWQGWLLVLVITVSLLLAGVVVGAVYKIFFGEIPELESEHVRKQRLVDTRNKLLRRGVNRTRKQTLAINLPARLRGGVGTPSPPSGPPPSRFSRSC